MHRRSLDLSHGSSCLPQTFYAPLGWGIDPSWQIALRLALPRCDTVEFAAHAKKQWSIHYRLIAQSTLFCLYTRSLQTDGYLARSYVQQLEDWKQRLKHHTINPENNFHALGTPLSGLYPIQSGRG